MPGSFRIHVPDIGKSDLWKVPVIQPEVILRVLRKSLAIRFRDVALRRIPRFRLDDRLTGSSVVFADHPARTLDDSQSSLERFANYRIPEKLGGGGMGVREH
jgi:hypothetical protein